MVQLNGASADTLCGQLPGSEQRKSKNFVLTELKHVSHALPNGRLGRIPQCRHSAEPRLRSIPGRLRLEVHEQLNVFLNLADLLVISVKVIHVFYVHTDQL